MRDGEPRPRSFSTREARRLGLLFAIVYFAQGMVYLPDQVVAIVFKERGLTAGQLATFSWIITTPWFIKPLYGLLRPSRRPPVGWPTSTRSASH